jgi:hypothetical protein
LGKPPYEERIKRGENYRKPPTKVSGGMVSIVVGFAVIFGALVGFFLGVWFL